MQLSLIHILQAVAVMIVAVGLVAVDGQHRAEADELQALTQDVWQGNIVCTVVVGIQGQNAAGEGIHHILTAVSYTHLDVYKRQVSFWAERNPMRPEIRYSLLCLMVSVWDLDFPLR